MEVSEGSNPRLQASRRRFLLFTVPTSAHRPEEGLVSPRASEVLVLVDNSHSPKTSQAFYLLTQGFLSSLHGGNSLFWPMASEDLCSLQQERHSRAHGAEPVGEPVTSWRSSNGERCGARGWAIIFQDPLLVTHSPAKPSRRFHNLPE